MIFKTSSEPVSSAISTGASCGSSTGRGEGGGGPNAWAARNGCTDASPSENTVADDVTQLVYECPAGAEVELYRVTGGGHAWPGSEASKAIEAAVGRNLLNGTIRMGRMGEAQFEATRDAGAVDRAETRPAADEKDEKKDEAGDGRPQAPKTQPALEPYREIFADRASVFVACPSEAR